MQNRRCWIYLIWLNCNKFTRARIYSENQGKEYWYYFLIAHLRHNITKLFSTWRYCLDISFFPLLCYALFQSVNVYHICEKSTNVRHRMAIENVYARECIARRAISVSRDILSASIAFDMPRARQVKRTKPNRSLWRPDVELYSNERQIAIAVPKEEMYPASRQIFNPQMRGYKK